MALPLNFRSNNRDCETLNYMETTTERQSTAQRARCVCVCVCERWRYNNGSTHRWHESTKLISSESCVRAKWIVNLDTLRSFDVSLQLHGTFAGMMQQSVHCDCNHIWRWTGDWKNHTPMCLNSFGVRLHWILTHFVPEKLTTGISTPNQCSLLKRCSVFYNANTSRKSIRTLSSRDKWQIVFKMV